MDLYNDVSFKTSKLITHRYSTSFSIAVSLLSDEMRQAIYSIYGFVRLADEIVDSFHDIDQELILNKFERDFYDALQEGISMNPAIHCFVLTVKRYDIPTHLVDSFLKSMKTDLHKQTYRNCSELNEYIYGSADVVGLMCLKVFVNGNEEMYRHLEQPAMKLGSAFQKVNFLRDLKADVEELDRSYFPQFRIDTFNDTVKNELISDIENDFQEAYKGMKQLPPQAKLAVYIAFVYYKQLLRNLQCTPSQKIMEERVRVAAPVKLMLLCKAYVKFQLNMI